MNRLGVLEEGRLGRGSRRPRRRRNARPGRVIGFVLLGIVLALVALLVFMTSRTSGPPPPSASRAVGKTHHHHASSTGGYGATLAAVHVRPHFKQPVQSGLLFDVHTGKVLWERNSSKRVAIASLTKMMTALVVAAHSRPSERVLIRRAAIDYSGSGVGLLPLHKKVPLETLLYGLMLPSGNDAAIALAQHVAGTQPHFIAMMNAEARRLGLSCTHFTTVSGIVDLGNYSCATDLAVLAHAVLTNHRLGHIVATSSIVLPFPIKGGKLYLYNNNPLLRTHYRGADGVKTGYTLAAGRCLVAAARRGHKWLGVVLLHSEDPPDQATQLLDEGFATRGA
jgi:serine-type D-Ala-D-Ala carboxypeptidase (penicillin-binding protein 5/6)